MKNTINRWVIVTTDHSGLGWTKLIQNQSGHEVILATKMKEDEEEKRSFGRVGSGMVETEDLDVIMKNRKQYKDYGFIWDGNHNSDQAEILRKEGFNIIGGHRFTDWLEHKREFGLNIIKKAGIATPPSFEFNDLKSGLDLLQSNPECAYVFKPDEPDHESWVTTTPDNDNDEEANKEMVRFINSQKDGKGKYILQERKKGVEINIETWLYKGNPFFAFANFECKRKDDYDLGRMIGCSQDVVFTIPIDCKIMKETMAKLIAQPEFKEYTGFIDLNLIVADNNYWFLEFCGRFGYNSHPNLLLTLAIDPMADIINDIYSGNIKDFGKHFRSGFGASITMWIDKPVAELPISFQDKDCLQAFYHFDTMSDGEEYFLAGYANEVGIITAHDYDIKSAADEVLRRFDKIHYPGRTGRRDIAQKDYISNPQERYIASEAMRLFQV